MSPPPFVTRRACSLVSTSATSPRDPDLDPITTSGLIRIDATRDEDAQLRWIDTRAKPIGRNSPGRCDCREAGLSPFGTCRLRPCSHVRLRRWRQGPTSDASFRGKVLRKTMVLVWVDRLMLKANRRGIPHFEREISWVSALRDRASTLPFIDMATKSLRLNLRKSRPRPSRSEDIIWSNCRTSNAGGRPRARPLPDPHRPRPT